jgi:hypothetical protein
MKFFVFAATIIASVTFVASSTFAYHPNQSTIIPMDQEPVMH